MVTESLENIPTAISPEYVPSTVFVPEGTMGVITGDKGEGCFSVITGLGLIRIDGRHLKRLGMALPDWADEP